MRAESKPTSRVALTPGLVIVALSLVGAPAAAQEASPPTEAPVVTGATFLPADTVLYLELRGDLPGDQAGALTQIMARFPGFATTAGFEAEADRALEAWLADATGGAFSWIEDVRSWFGGRVSVGLTGGYGPLVGGREPDFVAGLEVTDAQAAEALAARIREMAGATGPAETVEESHRGVTIVSSSAGRGAYAITDDLLLVGSGSREVRTALDVRAGELPSLADADGFRRAFARVPEARLGAGYADLAALREVIEAAMVLDPDRSADALAGMLDQLPLDITFYLAARPDGAIYQAFITPGTATPTFGTGTAGLAASFPAGTHLLFEAPDVGRTLAASMESMVGWGLTESPDEGTVRVLASAFDKLIGWIGDAAIGAGIDRGRIWVGLVMEGARPGAADVYVGALQAALAATALTARSSPYSPDDWVRVETSIVDGIEVTTASFTSAGTEIARLPIEPSISIAQDGELLVVGTSGFVTASIALEPGDSLASEARYLDALAAAGTPNAGSFYVDISGALGALQPLLALSIPDYAAVAPWLEPFDRAAVSYGVSDDGTLTTTFVLLLH